MSAMRNLSVLFADICNRATLCKKLGDAETARIVKHYLVRMERTVETAKGRIVKTVGDQSMAVFESADAAFQAAGEIQRQVNALPPVSGARLAVRIGFQHGEVDEENNDAAGAAVNLALRLTDLSKGGQVLTTAGTAALLSPRQREKTRPLEAVNVEDKDEAAQVFEVLWNRDDADPITFISAQLSGIKNLCLRLKQGANELWLSESRPTASIGRDPDADLVVNHTRVSRRHARIELRHGKYVLIDESANGTHVKLRIGPEVVLKREEMALHGHGKIAFGHSPEGSGEPLEFEVLTRKPETAGR